MLHERHRAVHQQHRAIGPLGMDGLHVAEGVPAREQNARRAGKRGKNQPEVLTGNPEQRVEVDRRVAGLERTIGRARRRGRVEHVALRMDASLRQARGPAGVVEGGDGVEVGSDPPGLPGPFQGDQEVVGIGRAGRSGHGFRHVEGGLLRNQGPDAGPVHLPDAGLALDRTHERDQCMVRDDERRLGVVELVRELVRLEHRVDGYVNRTRLEDAEESHRELRAVAEKHRHGVARADSFLLEQRREPVAEPIHLGERHDPAVVVVERRVRGLGGPVPEMVGQRDLAERVVRLPGHAGRPVGGLDGAEAVQVLGFGHDSVLIHGWFRRAPDRLSRSGSARTG